MDVIARERKGDREQKKYARKEGRRNMSQSKGFHMELGMAVGLGKAREDKDGRRWFFKTS